MEMTLFTVHVRSVTEGGVSVGYPHHVFTIPAIDQLRAADTAICWLVLFEKKHQDVIEWELKVEKYFGSTPKSSMIFRGTLQNLPVRIW